VADSTGTKEYQSRYQTHEPVNLPGLGTNFGGVQQLMFETVCNCFGYEIFADDASNEVPFYPQQPFLRVLSIT